MGKERTNAVRNGEAPAFSNPPINYPDGSHNYGSDGLSKLEYAAIHIAAGLSAQPAHGADALSSGKRLTETEIAAKATSIAIKIFEQLDKTNQ